MCEPVITMRFLRRRSEEGRFVRVCAYGEIAPGEIRRVEGLPIVLCRSGARIFAVSFMCPHGKARLVRGKLVDDCLECPLHGARFGLAGGEVRRGPARRGLLTYEVRVRDGEVYVSRVPRRRGWTARR
jgi:nitrite reductase/ring-hydroxylating ferredoxin subunit